MSRREDEKKRSLAALGRVADKAAEMPWLSQKPKTPPAPKPAPLPVRKAPAPKPASAPLRPAPPPKPKLDPRYEGRAAKKAEEERLRRLRDAQLAKGARSEWRGMSQGDVPTSIRRTAFDVVEPSVSQKIHDVLGDPRQKEGREKAREKGRRTGGR